MPHKLIKRLQRECVTDLNVFLGIILVLFLAIIIAFVLTEKDLYFKIMVILNMLIFPFSIRVYFYWKTKKIKNQGIMDEKPKCYLKILEMKETKNYIKKIQYISSLSEIIQKFIIYISDALLTFFILGVAGFILMFLRPEESKYILPGLIGLLLILILYFSLIFKILKNSKKISILKVLRDFVSYLLPFSILVFAFNIFFAPFVTKLVTNESIEELFKINLYLKDYYGTLAQISFMIFVGSFVVMEVLYNYFDKRNDIKNKLKAYGNLLLSEYKRYSGEKVEKTKNFKEFIKLYLTDEVEIELDENMNDITDLIFPIHFFKNIVLTYGFLGISFTLYPILLHEE